MFHNTKKKKKHVKVNLYEPINLNNSKFKLNDKKK